MGQSGAAKGSQTRGSSERERTHRHRCRDFGPESLERARAGTQLEFQKVFCRPREVMSQTNRCQIGLPVAVEVSNGKMRGTLGDWTFRKTSSGAIQVAKDSR